MARTAISPGSREHARSFGAESIEAAHAEHVMDGHVHDTLENCRVTILRKQGRGPAHPAARKQDAN